MKRIITFGASNSSRSINRKLASYTMNRIQEVETKLLDLNKFEMPIYSMDREDESGIPEPAFRFKQEIIDSDGIIISLAEHNGAYTTAFKNIFDWISRINKNIWENKPMLLLSTAPGPRGGKTVLELAYNRFQRGNSSPIQTFSLPSFGKNFSETEGILDSDLKEEFEGKLELFIKSVFGE